METVFKRKSTTRSFSLPAHIGKWKERKWELVEQEKLPAFLNDNQFLLQHHRPQLNSVLECLRSVFMLHTETLNVWTHLLGAIGVTFLYAYHICYISPHWQQTLIFSLFFVGAIICMAISAAYHALLCHSEAVFRLFAKFDYCGVILLNATSYFLWIYYSFYCLRLHRLFYVIFSATLSFIGIGVVIQDKFCEPRYMTFRACVFMTLGLISVFPGVHFITFESFRTPATSSITWMLTMAVCYLLGGLVYAAKIPERYFPGKFDIVFQSHQILHVAVVGGVLLCYRGASLLAAERELQGC